MPKIGHRAEAILVELYSSGTPFIDEYPWEHEHDRWKELLLCALVGGLQIEANQAKNVLDSLDGLGLVSQSTLAMMNSEDRELTLSVMLRHGLSRSVATSAVNAFERLGAMSQRTYGGFMQRFLRAHGQTMAEDLASRLAEALDLDMQATEKVAVLWLQRVANVPLLLPGDRHITEFCTEHDLSPEQLVEAADRLGLNISVLDDLLALQALTMRKIPSKRPQRTAKALRGRD